MYNEEILRNENFTLKGDNRAFLYGDGIFETIVVKDGKILYLDDHWERLKNGSKAFSIDLPVFLTKDYIINSLKKLKIKNESEQDFRVRLNLWRKSGGLYTPSDSAGEILLSMHHLNFVGQAIKEQAFFYEEGHKSFSSTSAYKTMSASHYVLASIEKVKKDADEMILTDIFGNISECLASNIFFIKDNTLFTPSLECACIDGITRKQILRLCNNYGMAVETGQYKKEQLFTADFVFSSNVSGLVQIKKIGIKSYSVHNEIFEKLKHLLNTDQTATAALI